MRGKVVSLVVGARPNFMKAAPLVRELGTRLPHIQIRLVHTGQHYDYEMNKVFFDELGLPNPDVNFNCNRGTQAEQTGRTMACFEEDCLKVNPSYVVVFGDVNPTLACSIAAKKIGLPVAHVEAGLRSFDMRMPEEVNRLLTDSISDLHFVTEESGMENLIREGKNPQGIHFVGNLMIDNLFHQLAKIKLEDHDTDYLNQFLTENEKYGVVTIHRPSNVDDERDLKHLVKSINELSKFIKLVFPVHPRTQKKLRQFDLHFDGQVLLTEPLSYSKFLLLWRKATFVLTDSGGLQEETTAFGIPCFTVRENTERPITLNFGTNTLVDKGLKEIFCSLKKLKSGKSKRSCKLPPLWDGNAASRIVDALEREF